MSKNTQNSHDNGILSASRQIFSTEIEESVVYTRIDGKYVDLSMAFIDMQDPLLLLSVYEQGKSDPDDDPSESVVLSVAEARLLRDLLNRPAVAAILDETKEHRMRRLPGFTLGEIQRLQDQLNGE